jgi:hypothetical protein
LRVNLVDSHGRWKRPCLQTTPECDQVVPNSRPYYARLAWYTLPWFSWERSTELGTRPSAHANIATVSGGDALRTSTLAAGLLRCLQLSPSRVFVCVSSAPVSQRFLVSLLSPNLVKRRGARTGREQHEAGRVLVQATHHEDSCGGVVDAAHDVARHAAVRGARHPTRLPVLEVHELLLALQPRPASLPCGHVVSAGLYRIGKWPIKRHLRTIRPQSRGVQILN